MGSDESHATTKERYQYTTSMDIHNTRYERIQSLIQNHMRHVRSESAREREWRYINANNNNNVS